MEQKDRASTFNKLFPWALRLRNPLTLTDKCRVYQSFTHHSSLLFSSFAQICGYVSSQVSERCFCEYFLPGLLLLAGDRIPNVRLTVSQVLVTLVASGTPHAHCHMAQAQNIFHLYSTENYSKREDVQKALQALQKDKDRDVVFYAQPQNMVRYGEKKSATKRREETKEK